MDSGPAAGAGKGILRKFDPRIVWLITMEGNKERRKMRIVETIVTILVNKDKTHEK